MKQRCPVSPALCQLAAVLALTLVAGCGGGTDGGSNAMDVTASDTADVPVPDTPGGVDSDTPPQKDTACVPACENKDCGDDGCGSSCGTCGLYNECSTEGQCTAVLDCIKAENVFSGTCPSPETCLCVGCVTDGTCDFFEDDCICPDCQTDGLCATTNACITDGQCDPYNEGCECDDCSAHPLCDCTPDCDGKVCGNDGCFGSCGACEGETVCSDDQSACEVCVPGCENKACGNDGCGGSCGVCSDGLGCVSSQCVDVTPGDSCANAKVIQDLPYTDTDDSTNYTDISSNFGPCAEDAEGDTGHLIPDVTYVFTPATSSNYVFAIAPVANTEPPPDESSEIQFDAIYFPNLIYLSTDCGWPVGAASTATTCEGFSGDLWNDGEGGSWVVALKAETTYFVVLDGALPGFNQGPYTFTLDTACNPDCENKSCGDDGCGGTCGTCLLNQVCGDDAACETPVALAGDSCENPLMIATGNGLPWSTTGDTSGATNTQAYSFAQCSGAMDSAGAFARDQLYMFWAEEPGVYTITVESTFDAALSVLKSCGESDSCMGGANNTEGSGLESVLVTLAAGEMVALVVDGAGLSSAAGPYTLSISAPCLPLCDGLACGDNGCGGTCGTCPDGSICDGGGACVDVSSTAGNTCINPLVVDAAALPYKATGDTSDGPTTDNYTGLYAFCPGLYEDTGKGAADHAYSFTPKSSGAYTVSVESTHDAAVYVPTSCGDIGNTCVLGHNGTEADTLLLQGEAGTTYFVIVDGHAGASGPYTLNVAVCAPACDGKSCGPDGCGSSCGSCDNDTVCTSDGQCVVPSCNGICGGDSPAGCYCDTLCFDFGDCCPDICEKCVEEFPGDPADCKP
jgi:hypothetical protein